MKKLVIPSVLVYFIPTVFLDFGQDIQVVAMVTPLMRLYPQKFNMTTMIIVY